MNSITGGPSEVLSQLNGLHKSCLFWIIYIDSMKCFFKEGIKLEGYVENIIQKERHMFVMLHCNQLIFFYSIIIIIIILQK